MKTAAYLARIRLTPFGTLTPTRKLLDERPPLRTCRSTARCSSSGYRLSSLGEMTVLLPTFYAMHVAAIHTLKNTNTFQSQEVGYLSGSEQRLIG